MMGLCVSRYDEVSEKLKLCGSSCVSFAGVSQYFLQLGEH